MRQTIFAVLLAFLAAPISASGADSSPPLSDLIARVVARDAANQKALQAMEYHEVVSTERLDARGKITGQEELRMIVRPGAAQEVQVLSAKGDNLPSDMDEAAQQARGQEAQKKKMNFALKDMVGRFEVTEQGMGQLMGQPVYILGFEPKADQAYRDETEKVLNHLHGRMWISTQDYSVLKTEASLAQPVDVAWIFAQVSALNFHYELNNTSGGMGPSRIEVSVAVDAPFIAIRQRMTVDMTDFRPRANTLAKGK
jgi:hypothetical protein